MNIQDFYKAIDSDYCAVEQRFGSCRLVEHFVSRFAGDNSCLLLRDSYAKKDAEGAFRAAHTLKGVSGNLGFAGLYRASSALTEALRGSSLDGSEVLYQAVEAEYNRVMDALRNLGTAE